MVEDKSLEIIEEIREKIESGKYEVSISPVLQNEDIWVLTKTGKRKLENNGTYIWNIKLREKKAGEIGLVDVENKV